jgi:hypothetical protein
MERNNFAERLPQDLREYVSENPSIPACETEPARVEMEVYELPSMKLTTYFPPGPKGRKLLNVHYPGGKLPEYPSYTDETKTTRTFHGRRIQRPQLLLKQSKRLVDASDCGTKSRVKQIHRMRLYRYQYPTSGS